MDKPESIEENISVFNMALSAEEIKVEEKTLKWAEELLRRIQRKIDDTFIQVLPMVGTDRSLSLGFRRTDSEASLFITVFRPDRVTYHGSDGKGGKELLPEEWDEDKDPKPVTIGELNKLSRFVEKHFT